MANPTRRHFLKGTALFLGATCCAPNALAGALQRGSAANTLIACFSHTGNTALVATEIQRLTRGILHRIRTVEVYPQEHDACSRIAGRELRTDSRPRLSSRVEDMDRFATIFLGYPIWWHTMPMACRAFLEAYDFTNKTLIPFCTHGRDGFANSLRDIRRLCPKSTLLAGYHTYNAHGRNMPAEVEEWLGRIGMLAG